MILTKKQEDYLETIWSLINDRGYARITDISKKLGLNPSSVHSMVKSLNQKGLVQYHKSAPVMLTPKGIQIAKNVKMKHETFQKFFKLLKVPEHIAKQDALKIEHNLNPITIEHIEKFVDFCLTCPSFESDKCKFLKLEGKES